MEDNPQLVDMLIDDLGSTHAELGDARTKVNQLEQVKDYAFRAFRPITGKVETLSKQFEIPLKIRGIAIMEGTYNGVKYSWEELQKGYKTLEGCPWTVDHPLDSADARLKVREKIGEITNVSLDEKIRGIRFESYTVDEDIARRIFHGLVDSVSIGAVMDQEFRKKGIAKDIRFVEISSVLNPACKGAKTEVLEMLANGGLDKMENVEMLGVTPTNPKDYGKSTADWKAPTLGDFTSKSWDELDDSERRAIASHFAWARVSPPEKYGDLKLPHHDSKSHNVVWRGVTAAMAVLLGARGGVDIPSGDKRTVYGHLVGHYKEFEKKPPEFRMASIGTDKERLIDAYGVEVALTLMNLVGDDAYRLLSVGEVPKENKKGGSKVTEEQKIEQETKEDQKNEPKVEERISEIAGKIDELSKRVDAFEKVLKELAKAEEEVPKEEPKEDENVEEKPEDETKETLEELKARIEKLENLPDRVSIETGEGKGKEIAEKDFLALLRSEE